MPVQTLLQYPALHQRTKCFKYRIGIVCVPTFLPHVMPAQRSKHQLTTVASCPV